MSKGLCAYFPLNLKTLCPQRALWLSHFLLNVTLLEGFSRAILYLPFLFILLYSPLQRKTTSLEYLACTGPWIRSPGKPAKKILVFLCFGQGSVCFYFCFLKEVIEAQDKSEK